MSVQRYGPPTPDPACCGGVLAGLLVWPALVIRWWRR
jgi:hypothetical protein